MLELNIIRLDTCFNSPGCPSSKLGRYFDTHNLVFSDTDKELPRGIPQDLFFVLPENHWITEPGVPYLCGYTYKIQMDDPTQNYPTYTVGPKLKIIGTTHRTLLSKGKKLPRPTDDFLRKYVEAKGILTVKVVENNEGIYVKPDGTFEVFDKPIITSTPKGSNNIIDPLHGPSAIKELVEALENFTTTLTPQTPHHIIEARIKAAKSLIERYKNK